MSGGIEDASREERGGYAPLINHKVGIQHKFPENDALKRAHATSVKVIQHPLQKVFDEVINQVSKGKGEERHGNGKEFMQQPWRGLCDTYGVGFAFGQCQKKLAESQGMTGEARKRELLGAIAYLAIGVLYENYLDKQN